MFFHDGWLRVDGCSFLLLLSLFCDWNTCREKAPRFGTSCTALKMLWRPSIAKDDSLAMELVISVTHDSVVLSLRCLYNIGARNITSLELVWVDERTCLDVSLLEMEKVKGKSWNKSKRQEKLNQKRATVHDRK